uniref:Sperm flagellar 1 n=1 Tax=Scleropages formosus TaxID=113540 RepID=A0A8C9SP10_SCLFO
MAELMVWTDSSMCPVMAAEVVKHFFPKLVDLHNYTTANSTQQKVTNWITLNRKVFSKLNFHVPEDFIKKIALNTAGFIEPVLYMLREKIEERRHGKTVDKRQDLKYSNNTYLKQQEVPEYLQIPKMPVHLKPIPSEMIEKPTHLQKARPESLATESQRIDPAFQHFMEEKEKTLLGLQETVEVLQIKVNRLEHLLQLKDLHIDDLTKHLEKYKSRANMP